MSDSDRHAKRGASPAAGDPKRSKDEMAFKLPPLPWAEDALAPVMSKECIQFHYGKHHAGYVNKLNLLTKDKPEANKTVEELIREAPAGGIFNCAAQIWNHTFFWNCLAPPGHGGGGEPTGPLLDAIKRDFGDYATFRKAFSDKAINHFASGWAWLIKQPDGKLAVVDTHDASNPIRENLGVPLLTCDVWEHAYYIDHRNDRGKFLEAYWQLVNWQFVAHNFATAK